MHHRPTEPMFSRFIFVSITQIVKLFSTKGFSDLLELAEKGNRRNVDLLVKDTAGSHYGKAPPEGMVSSFGKPAKDLSINTG